MKSYSQSPGDGTQFTSLIIPHGRTLPRGARQGEIFQLEADLPPPIHNDINGWYPRGTYICNGVTWEKLNDAQLQRKAAPIGSQILQFLPEDKSIRDISKIPTSKDGFELATVLIKPSNVRSQLTGIASLWTFSREARNVWFTVFRDSTLVGLTADFLPAKMPRSVSMTFIDAPARKDQTVYTLRVVTDVVGDVYINKTGTFDFDGMSQTAFIVQENS